MTQKNDPALPNAGTHLPSGDYNWPTIGLTAVEHAALVTGQPCSGTPWLDDMLAKARRERLAGQALAGILQNHKPEVSNIGYVYPSDKEPYCRASVAFADSLISALEGGAK